MISIRQKRKTGHDIEVMIRFDRERILNFWEKKVMEKNGILSNLSA